LALFCAVPSCGTDFLLSVTKSYNCGSATVFEIAVMNANEREF
jgi:hypothetical protein